MVVDTGNTDVHFFNCVCVFFLKETFAVRLQKAPVAHHEYFK